MHYDTENKILTDYISEKIYEDTMAAIHKHAQYSFTSKDYLTEEIEFNKQIMRSFILYNNLKDSSFVDNALKELLHKYIEEGKEENVIAVTDIMLFVSGTFPSKKYLAIDKSYTINFVEPEEYEELSYLQKIIKQESGEGNNVLELLLSTFILVPEEVLYDIEAISLEAEDKPKDKIPLELYEEYDDYEEEDEDYEGMDIVQAYYEFKARKLEEERREVQERLQNLKVDDKTVGERIQEARQRMNLTQAELAKKCRISVKTLIKYENDEVEKILADKIEKIAAACEVSPAYLMGWYDVSEDEKKKLSEQESETLPVGGQSTIGKRIQYVISHNKYFNYYLRESNLAEKIDVPAQVISRYENDNIKNISLNIIELIAAACGISPAYIMGWIEEE